MKKTRHIVGTFLLALLVWGWMTYPLPRHAARAIPASSYTDDSDRMAYMIPGDHLQFLYHLWLAKDTFFGPTPWFHNLYEFNTGDDADRRAHNTYYLPFSLFFSLGSALGSQASGWNATAILSLWLTALFTFLLARRYTRSPALAGLAAAVSLLLPYRWFTLCGGSPTGLAMMWTPIVLYGLDRWVRDKSWTGSLLAGASIYFSGWSDSHVFFFTALSAPAWCLMAALYHRDRLMPDRTELKRYALSAIPLVIFFALIVLQVTGVKEGLEDTALNDVGRSLREITLFSPHLRGVLSADHGADSRQLYVGWLMILLLIGGAGAWTATRVKRKPFPVQQSIAAALLLLGIVGMTLLSAGVHNPFGPRAWSALTKLIPPYGMIRQPAKIYVLLPVWLGLALTVLYSATLERRPRLAGLLCLLAGLLILADAQRLVRPRLCLLQHRQGAYEAVSRHAAAERRQARLLILPLWPGDAHWSSLYQYYVSLYRLRMMNGYRPTARRTYVENIYLPFESFNKGGYTDAQLDELIDRGVNYLMLHENAFPEKVSPFSVGTTLRALLMHPRLRPLGNDGPAWAFEILERPLRKEPMTLWDLHCPARLWQGESLTHTAAEIADDPPASGGRYLRMAETGAAAELPPYPMPYMDDLRYSIRVRGEGELAIDWFTNGVKETRMRIDSTDWTWEEARAPEFEGYRGLPLRWTLENGSADIDIAIPAAGPRMKMLPGERLVVPAPCFFHAGYTDLQDLSVVLRPRHDPPDVIFYGPKWPLPAGRYRMELAYKSPAPEGALLGWLDRRYPGPGDGPAEVRQGEPAVFVYEQDRNIRAALDFRYSGAAPIRIHHIIIERQ